MAVEHDKDQLELRAIECGLPHYMINGLVKYILEGIPVGHFLTAVLTNDLKTACSRADEVNRNRLYDYVFFLYNHAPQGCWGSQENYDKWVQRKGLRGVMESASEKQSQRADGV